MAFQQLHYTSCANGPAGYSGYQFSAITPGTSPTIMREVEELTAYQPPACLLASPSPDEPDAYPVAFSHAASAATGAAITTHVVFAGTDYSGRPGNYFAHALVTGTPELDFGSLLPAELWGADLWQFQPAVGTELPELPGPPPRGIIHRTGVQAFLDAQGADSLLAELLTAVSSAIAGARPVLLASRDVTESAWWIAAISYLLGERLGRRMTFTTYSHQPDSVPFHLIGIPSDALPPDAGTGFQLFDLASGKTPASGVHPLAAMLADTGVVAAPGLWRQAAAFASGAEESLDDWLAPVAVAAGLLGRRLSLAQADAVARWIGDAISRLPVDVADAAIGVALAQPDETLTEERLLDLLATAGRVPAPTRVAHIENLLIERAVMRITRGESAAAIRLTGRGAEAAATRAVRLLDAATPATALAVLDWAEASGIGLPDGRLEQYGHSCLDQGPPGPELAQLLRRSRAVLHGLLSRLDGEPPQVAEAVLAGPVGVEIRRDDLHGYPGLTELWLLQSAAQGRVAPLRAFDEIADARAWAGRSPRVDGTLLSRLWPAGCPPDQITELLALVMDKPAQDAVDWLSAQIGAVAAQGAADASWYRLAEVVAGHPVQDVLPAADLRIMQNAAQAGPLLSRAQATAPHGDANVFAELFALYRAADDSRTRGLLEQYLPMLLAAAEPLGPALSGCPESVALAFRHELESRLATPQADIPLAARAFAALAGPDRTGQPAVASQLQSAVEPVRGWRRRDLGALSRALEGDSEAIRLLQEWRDARPGRLSRMLFGAGTEPPAETN